MPRAKDDIESAVREISSVVVELRGLQQRVKQYADASDRLKEVSNTIGQVAANITKIHVLFEKTLDKAGDAHAQLEASRISVENMAQALPGLIKSVESSDVSKIVVDFATHVASMNNALKLQRENASESYVKLSKELQEQFTLNRGIRDQVGKFFPSFDGLSSLVKNLSAQINRTNTKIDVIAEFAVKMMEELGSIKSEMYTVKEELAANSQTLQHIKKRKGIIF